MQGRVPLPAGAEPETVEPRHRTEHRTRPQNWGRGRHPMLRPQQTLLHQSTVFRRRGKRYFETV